MAESVVVVEHSFSEHVSDRAEYERVPPITNETMATDVASKLTTWLLNVDPEHLIELQLFNITDDQDSKAFRFIQTFFGRKVFGTRVSLITEKEQFCRLPATVMLPKDELPATFKAWASENKLPMSVITGIDGATGYSEPCFYVQGGRAENGMVLFQCVRVWAVEINMHASPCSSPNVTRCGPCARSHDSTQAFTIIADKSPYKVLAALMWA